MKKIRRLPALQEIYPKSKSKIYEEIADGLFVPPVKLSPRVSVWIDDEVHPVIDARISGKSEDEIRKLVSNIVSARKTAA